MEKASIAFSSAAAQISAEAAFHAVWQYLGQSPRPHELVRAWGQNASCTVSRAAVVNWCLHLSAQVVAIPPVGA